MAKNFRLLLDCNWNDNAGDFNNYLAVPGRPFSFPNSPEGQAWWVEDADHPGVWNPTPRANGDASGNPKFAKPKIKNGSKIEVWVRDNNKRVSSVTVGIVFGKVHGNPNQAAIASPFQDEIDSHTMTTFHGVADGPQGPNGEWFVYTLPAARFPKTFPKGKSFTFYVGAVLIYELLPSEVEATQRQFGLDPELEVEDLGGSVEPPLR